MPIYSNPLYRYHLNTAVNKMHYNQCIFKAATIKMLKETYYAVCGDNTTLVIKTCPMSYNMLSEVPYL